MTAKANSILQVIRRQIRISHRHGQARMTQDLLQREDVAAVLDEVAGEGMPERMGGLPFR